MTADDVGVTSRMADVSVFTPSKTAEAYYDMRDDKGIMGASWDEYTAPLFSTGYPQLNVAALEKITPLTIGSKVKEVTQHIVPLGPAVSTQCSC
jgi:hypothetical protein